MFDIWLSINTRPISIEPEWYPGNPRVVYEAPSIGVCHCVIYNAFSMPERCDAAST